MDTNVRTIERYDDTLLDGAGTGIVNRFDADDKQERPAAQSV